jgi:hypothetical protein
VKRIDDKRLISADELDGRTRAHRAFNALVAGITADLGGEDRLSSIERVLIQAFAGASVHAADLNARLLQGDPIDLTEHAAMIGAMVRIASRLGVGRRPRELGHDLTGYLARQVSPDPSDSVSSDQDASPSP